MQLLEQSCDDVFLNVNCKLILLPLNSTAQVSKISHLWSRKASRFESNLNRPCWFSIQKWQSGWNITSNSRRDEWLKIAPALQETRREGKLRHEVVKWHFWLFSALKCHILGGQGPFKLHVPGKTLWTTEAEIDVGTTWASANKNQKNY